MHVYSYVMGGWGVGPTRIEVGAEQWVGGYRRRPLGMGWWGWDEFAEAVRGFPRFFFLWWVSRPIDFYAYNPSHKFPKS